MFDGSFVGNKAINTRNNKGISFLSPKNNTDQKVLCEGYDFAGEASKG